MKRTYRALFAILVIAALMAATTLTVFAATSADREDMNDGRHFRAHLTGFQQVPTLYSIGSGTFTATLSDDGTTLTYTLTYSGLTGVTMAHIHLGARGTNGGIVVFLCGGGGKPACPASSGTVTGTITSSDVLALTSQGLAAGNFPGLLASLRAGATYVNVHTAAFPAGEIRGQIAGNGE